MNPRIYKKQAKRAVELLRSYGGWPDMPEVFKVDRWDHPCADSRRKDGLGIDGSPVFGWMSSTQDGQDWCEACPRDHWMDLHYWTFIVPDDYFKSGDEELPTMTKGQRMERWRRNQIAPGWCWRGGRAVRIAGTAP